MNVYQKLNDARAKFHKKALKKSGHNKFAGYNYFELADFVVPAIEIFNEVGLTSIVRFNKEQAELIVVNVDKPEEIIVFTSPMSEANLKGCHPVQNLGAVQTYISRYLWTQVLLLIEHDMLDSTTGSQPTMDAQELADHLAAIDACTTLDELKKAHTDAIKATGGDVSAQKKIIAAKDAKKGGLK
jgi:hypothetical protein